MPTETHTVTPAPDGTDQAVTLKGVVTRLSDEAHGDAVATDNPVKLFRIIGQGYLPLDFSAVNLGPSSLNEISVSVSVPASIDLTGSAAEDFTALQAFTLGGGTLAVLDIVKSIGLKNIDGQINTMPATAAVHKVYAVLMTPYNYAATSPAANQTSAKVALAVQHASQYWSDQSNGAITFALQGTVPWYKTTNSVATCANTDTGADALWAEAATKAAAQIGYKDAPNNHLVLFLPSGNGACGAPIGLAAVGRTINEGGAAWVIGTNANAGELSTLAHELGHNLSFGHANWADCSTANPYPGFMGYVGCTIKNYGDIQDVMGFGVADKSGGSLSSPQAIRAGLWDTDDYTVAPQGTSSYTLQAVSAGTGKRGVVVQDNLGAEYFVEFRNFVGTHEAQYAGAGGCANGSGAGSDFCVGAQPGVRILRLEQQNFGGTYYNGIWGDDSYLIGRVEGGVKKVNYQAGGTFTSQSSGGITVTVNSINSGTSATVTITRPSNTVSVDFVTMTRVGGGTDNNMRVGETYMAVLGAYWEADAFSYKWYRTGVLIPGATKQSYTLSGADLGKNMRVVVTATATGQPSRTVTEPSANYIGYAPVLGGSLDAGTVNITSSATGLTANLAGWTAGATNSLQWYRGTTAITGAKSATYVPTAADRDAQLKVRVTSTKSGFTAATAETVPAVYTVNLSSGTLAISGAATVGATLSTNNLIYATTQVPGNSAVTRSYQWLRAGVAIPGATSATYSTVAADFGKAITVRVVATIGGFAPHTATSAVARTITTQGTILGSHAVPVISKVSLVLTAALPLGAVTESGAATAWQWTRDGVPINGAIKTSYTLAAGDVNKLIAARATVSKLQYETVVLTSAATNHSLLASGLPTLSGVTSVGRTLSVSTPSYSTTPPTGATVTVAYQWYRSGVLIAGATSATYGLVAADYNKTITVRTTGTLPGYLPATGPSAATALVAKGVIGGSQTSATVTKNTAGTVLTAAATAGSITEPGVVLSYQWYRNGVAIAKATAPTFAVTTADRAKQLHVRIIVTKLNYTSATLLSTPINYTVHRALNPDTDGTIRVGGSVTVNSSWHELDGVITPLSPQYQWLRAGVVIPNATGETYVPVAADLGKALSVRVMTAAPGYISYLGTSPAKVVAPGVLATPYTVPVVQRVGKTLTLGAPDGSLGSVGEPTGVTYGYQWYRSGVAIAGATKASYTLVAADAGKLVNVRQLASKVAYTAVPLLSSTINYSLQRSEPPVILGAAKVAEMLSINSGTFFLYNGGSVEDTAPAYQWYRSGVAIVGGTGASYTLVPADLGKLITVRLTKVQEPTLAYIATSAPTTAVLAGTIQGSQAVPTISKDDATLTLTASETPGSVTEGGVKRAWQWYRAGVAIPKATAASYKLVAADHNKLVHVRLTVTKPAYGTLALNAAPANTSVVASTTLPVITGDVAIGQELSVAARNYSNEGAATYQWLRTGVVIPTATQSTYTPIAADKGKAISVRVTAAASGFLPSISTSAATQLVAAGYLVGGNGAVVTVTKDASTPKLTAISTGVTGPDPVVRAYQWYRSGVAIAKATAATYTPVAADFNKLLSVRVIHTKALYTTVVAWSTAVNVSVIPTGTAVISPALPVRGTAATVTTPSFAAPDAGSVSVSYQWYRSGVAIALATSSSYTPVTADKGKLLSVRVTGARAGYLPAIVASAATKALK